MLHTQTVESGTLQLLKDLESESRLSSFCLAGGTALALYLGHRKSVDLDLFSPLEFDASELGDFLGEKYDFRTDFLSGHTLKGTIDGVKIDCITHKYPHIGDPFVEDGIRLFALEDIIAMKLSAISDNGSRLKDFIDIAYLSTLVPFREMLACYSRKFPQSNAIIPLKAITYFDDIDFEESVILLSDEFQWDRIAKRLTDMVKDQSRVFDTRP